LFVGWDWASTAHDVTVIDSAGELVHRMAIPHTEDGIARAMAKLADYGDPGELPVAIEATRGLVVDRLLAAGHPVVPVHPNAFHAVPRTTPGTRSSWPITPAPISTAYRCWCRPCPKPSSCRR
jgi:Transposase